MSKIIEVVIETAHDLHDADIMDNSSLKRFDTLNQHTGSNFDDFLAEEGILEEASAKAHKWLLTLHQKRVIRIQNIMF